MRALAILLIFWAGIGSCLACEPASIDWQHFFAQYDRNGNGQISEREFKRVGGFFPYHWPNRPYLSHRNLFAKLDINQDGALDQDELSGVYTLLSNPYLGLPD